MPWDEAWDWPFLLYVATVILKRTERQFWRMSPRKLNALTKAHVAMNTPSESGEKTTGYVDQIY